MDKLINKCVLKGNDVLFLQDKVQSYSRLQVKSRSISEIFSTDISHGKEDIKLSQFADDMVVLSCSVVSDSLQPHGL